MNLIEQLTDLVGFHKSYSNHFGQEVFPTEQARRSLLKAMGYELDDTSLKNAIRVHTEEEWRSILPNVHIFNEEESNPFITICLPSNENITDELKVDISIIEESNKTHSYTYLLNELDSIEQHQLSNTTYTKYQLPLPQLALGYHTYKLTFNKQQSSCHLISTPKSCYSAKDANAENIWGYAVQLYSIKNNNYLGLSNYTDLESIVKNAANSGASIIGLNPLHPLYANNPAHISPYSPSTRCFLNSLYIDVLAIFNFKQCDAAQKEYTSVKFQEDLANVNKNTLVDYPYAAHIKQKLLKLLFDDFDSKQDDIYIKEKNSFERFITEQGEKLQNFSTYEALYEYFYHNFPNSYGWKQWSKEYHSPELKSVKEFQKKNQACIRYYHFVQWIAHQQLTHINKVTKKEKMSVGLYLDLAVGCDGGGFDVWSNQSLYVNGASVGAPPDAMNNLGQDWGLTPMNPVELKRQGYKPLIQALKSNMQYAGALRIDHILGLMRQYWVAPGMKADEGMYISFPFQDILQIIALESQRNQCIVIGEDLGIVPEGFSEEMQSYGLLSYKILFFERWESGLFKRPETYPSKAMVTISTHDLPTLNGWWKGRDLEWRQKLELYPTEEMGESDRSARVHDKARLIDALTDLGVLDMNHTSQESIKDMDTTLSISVHKYLAQAPSHIHLIPLEDALEITEQVNIPGTVDEHPNWRQILPVSVENIWEEDSVNNIASAMRTIRPI